MIQPKAPAGKTRPGPSALSGRKRTPGRSRAESRPLPVSALPGEPAEVFRLFGAFRPFREDRPRYFGFAGRPDRQIFRFCRAARQADISVFREGAAACPGFFGGLAGAFQVCREDRPGRVSVSQEGRPAHFGFAERPGRGGRAFFFRPDPGKAGEAFPSGAGLGQKIKIFRTAGPCLARIVLDFGGYDIV